jgi:hypothetical protein
VYFVERDRGETIAEARLRPRLGHHPPSRFPVSLVFWWPVQQ